MHDNGERTKATNTESLASETNHEQKEHHNSKSPLLGLPGELRNRIYELVAVDEKPIRIKHLNSELARMKEIAFLTGDDDTACDIQFTGVYAGLAGLCRQIREEYLLMHRQRSCATVDYNDLEQFIVTFFDDKEPFKEVHILPSGGLGSDYIQPFESDNVLPLLRAKTCFPDLFVCNIEFGEEPSRFIWGSAIEDPSWQSWRARMRWFRNLQNLLQHGDTRWLESISANPCIFEAVNYRPHTYGFRLSIKHQHAVTHLECCLYALSFLNNVRNAA
ncbi:hypothetical protein P171DRAFT_484314 [Karstenula rhodostoma CBS 690.94]|uniref:Uncharacterized protein n=1 Tax=Karstenula rhodostoma CBS 690.94 TaxID=1392251 RepID=A0A9P4PKJ7_9PLEO|nr:hypothetical protein P171DRAFT_484314 [Karstenula rhodostoma CBS 690.94]